MGWLVFWLLVLVVLIALVYRRNSNHSYRMGSGMFKSSEYNLDEKEELSDKEYYDKDGLMK